MKTNVYVDAFNLYYGSLKGTQGRKWLDLRAWLERLFPNNEIQRIRYFTALVDARPNDPQQPARQQAYLRAIKTLPGVSIHYGNYRSRPARMRLAHPEATGPNTVEVIKTEEKGSDVNLASFLLLDAFRKDCEVGIVVSNDADLKMPVEIGVNELGLRVGVVNPHPYARRSRDLKPTFFKQARPGPIQASQLPRLLRDETGEIRKPGDW